MSGLGHVHDNESNSRRKGCCEPLQPVWGIVSKVELENGSDDDTNESAEEVTENKGTRLGERDVDGTITQNGRSTLKSQWVYTEVRINIGSQMMPQLAGRFDS